MKHRRDTNRDPLFPSSIFRASIGSGGSTRIARYRDDVDHIHQASVGQIVLVVIILVVLMLGSLLVL